METIQELLEEIKVYFDYIPLFYLFTIFVIFAVYRYFDTKSKMETKRTNDIQESDSDSTEDELIPENIQAQVKAAKHRAIFNQLTANMTDEQLEEERRIEEAQLSAIYKLLQEQQDKFQVNDQRDFEEQLNLYRKI